MYANSPNLVPCSRGNTLLPNGHVQVRSSTTVRIPGQFYMPAAVLSILVDSKMNNKASLFFQVIDNLCLT